MAVVLHSIIFALFGPELFSRIVSAAEYLHAQMKIKNKAK